MFTAGQRFGPYEIQSEIARGGQGVLYSARHSALGTPIALKVLLDPDPRALLRFRQEGQVLSRLDHPNLLSITDMGEVSGHPYLALQLLEGEDLGSRLKRTGPPPFEWSASVLAQVAEALHYCHGKGIVHRDVKPANIMLARETDRPVLIDFGLLGRDADSYSLSVDSGGRLSLSGEAKGTPAYMSPEQIGGERADASADVYALGATLFHLLTGEPPYSGATAYNVYTAVLRDTPPPDPRECNPRVPEHLARLCMSAMAKSPTGRPVSALEVARGLEAPRASGTRWWVLAATGVLLFAAAALTLALGTQPDPTPGPGPTPSPPPPTPPAPVVTKEAPPSDLHEPSPPPRPSWRSLPYELGITGPAPRSGHAEALVHVPRRGVHMIGGHSAGMPSLGLWLWAEGRWQPSLPDDPESYPASRYVHAMAWHAERRELVVFGGLRPNTQADTGPSTWIYRPDRELWEKHEVPAPAPRFWHTMDYDAERKVVLLYGGYPSTEGFVDRYQGSHGKHLGDLWAWDGKWKQLPAPSSPPPRKAHAMTYMPDLELTVVFGGDQRLAKPDDALWAWDGELWKRLPSAGPGPGNRHGAALLAIGSGRLLLSGGCVGQAGPPDLWLWERGGWTRLPDVPLELGPRAWHGLAWDPAERVALLFGGRSYDAQQMGDTWLLSLSD